MTSMVRPLVLALLCSLPLFAAPKPNVVFVLSDNQSYYEMGCHGHAVVKTPHIDALATESVDFSHFYAPPFCSPSRAVILTGRYAMRSGVHNTIGGRSILHAKETTLPDILKKAGYQTAIFGKWHLGFSYPHRPEDRGFDDVFVHGGGGIGQMEDYFGNTHFSPTFLHNGKVTPSEGFSTDVLFERAIEYIKASKAKPFFCFVSTPVTHSPHRGPAELVAKLRAAGVTKETELVAQIQNLDTNIGKLRAALDTEGLADNTLFIYASDQGMNDRGAPHGANRLSLGHDPAHHCPFMVRLPAAQRGKVGRVNSRLAGMIDVFPTILTTCGVEAPDNIDGLSLMPLLTDSAGYPEDRTLIVQCPRGRTAKKWVNASVKTDRWRLVGEDKLYDITADPRQKKNIAAEHPEVVAKLRAAYETYWADLPDQTTTLSRHLIGHPDAPETVLNGMDWHTGAAPWNSGHLKGKRGGNGSWAVTIERDGRYRFDCYHYPREANKATGATKARIQIGEIKRSVDDVDPSKPFVRFELELKAGEMDLQTWLTRGAGENGALFVVVNQVKQE